MATLQRQLLQRRLDKAAQEISWREVSSLLSSFVKLAEPVFPLLRQRLQASPFYLDVHWHPYRREAHIRVDRDDAIKTAAWEETIGDVPGVDLVTLSSEAPEGQSDGDEPWILVKRADATTRAIAQASNFMPNPVNKLFGGPNPLAATLTGGLLGAGLGYGAGWLGEQIMGDKVLEKGKLRRLFALLGGGLGMVPGLGWGYVAHRKHPDTPGFRAWLSSWPVRPQDMQPSEPEPEPEAPEPEVPEPTGFKPEASFKGAMAAARQQYPDIEVEEHFRKAALAAANLGGAFDISNLPAIPKNNFGQVVWQDDKTPLAVRAATTGLLESASQLRGGSPWVTPVDVARIGMGMGSGYVSGLVVGKTLGALAGLTPSAQNTLQQAGTWAGVLSGVVPIIFGR